MSLIHSNAEDRLRQRVRVLRDHYIQAVAAAELACTEFADKSLPAPDGSLAYRKTLIAEAAARRAYTQAVADLTYLKRQNPHRKQF